MIGLFDSGIGGLSVLKRLMESCPNESFIYLGDTARLPYGTKSSETLKRYTLQNIEFLKSKGATKIISACHSASSCILEHNIQIDTSLYNVIEPSCQEALLATKNKRIGLMATQTTVSSGQYQRLIPSIQPVAAPLLVPLVEVGWTDDEITDAVIARYAEPLLKAEIDTLILGCTHFPLLQQSLKKHFGDQVHLVDPGESLADLLSVQSESTEESLSHEDPPEIYLTDTSPHFLKIAQAILMRFDLQVQLTDLKTTTN